MNWFEYKTQVDNIHAPNSLKERLLAMQEDMDPSDAPKMRKRKPLVHKVTWKHWKGTAIAACCLLVVLAGTQLYPLYTNKSNHTNYALSGGVGQFAANDNNGSFVSKDSAAAESGITDTVPNLQQTKLRESPQQRMVIYTTHLSLEATDYDTTRDALTQALDSVEGYVSQQDESTPSNQQRTLNCTYKVPMERYHEFLDLVAKSGNLTHSNETSDDITSEYIDVEARTDALAAQRDQLLAMQEQATELSDLLAIQEQLTQVQGQLESLQQQLNYYNEQTSYCTIHVCLEEVDVYSATGANFLTKISTAFVNGIKDFGYELSAILLGIIHLFPWILIIAIVLFLIFKKRK